MLIVTDCISCCVNLLLLVNNSICWTPIRWLHVKPVFYWLQGWRVVSTLIGLDLGSLAAGPVITLA
jgi:hypothetical protein